MHLVQVISLQSIVLFHPLKFYDDEIPCKQANLLETDLLVLSIKMAGLSSYSRSADPPINPTMQSAPDLFWFLTSSCIGSISGALCLKISLTRV